MVTFISDRAHFFTQGTDSIPPLDSLQQLRGSRLSLTHNTTQHTNVKGFGFGPASANSASLAAGVLLLFLYFRQRGVRAARCCPLQVDAQRAEKVKTVSDACDFTQGCFLNNIRKLWYVRSPLTF